jgi:molecular chaperone HtpG
MASEKREFQAEVSRLLDIVAHSLYSEKEIFLRELISNASDACDRLRYLALTEPALTAGDANFRVVIEPDKKKRTLILSDNGIGMSRQEMIENLGTIARSGTAAFVKELSGDSKKDVALIGQFGVGFYSAFMVASEVEVVSRKAGEEIAHRWVSNGKGAFTIEEAAREKRGTTITIQLNEADEEYAEPDRIRQIVKKYSDHIALPIVLNHAGKEETLNAASALWMRPRNEITADQYKEFYHHVAHAFDEPWLTLHHKVEGTYEYTTLLFIPGSKPFDLFDPQRKHHVKLYVRRVFITDDAQELLPPYLRFLRGVVDSEDLPLNVSREMLQNNPMLRRMRGQITTRVLGELAKKAKDEPAEFAKFAENFGAVLKEGIYEDREHKDEILPLARFRSTAGDALVALDDYIARMKPGQDAIYTIAGEDLETLKKSPQLEGFRARGIEVLLLTDPVDEFWMPAIGDYQKKEFKSVTRGAADLDKIAPEEKKDGAAEEKPDGDLASLVALLKLTLGDAVKDVRPSKRLTDSAVCLVADERDIDMHLERLLRQHKQLGVGVDSKRILEINPKHALIAKLVDLAGKDGATDALGDFAWLLLDQARILEGESLPDPAAFAKRLSSVLARGLAA